ncbi:MULTISPECIES: DUF3343 domain-containing protein [Deferrisoma]
MDRDGILIFHSIHRVMAAEKALKAAGLDVRLMPVPRQLSSDCGLSIAFRTADLAAVEEALEAGGCPYEELHRWNGTSYDRLDRP